MKLFLEACLFFKIVSVWVKSLSTGVLFVPKREKSPGQCMSTRCVLHRRSCLAYPPHRAGLDKGEGVKGVVPFAEEVGFMSSRISPYVTVLLSRDDALPLAGREQAAQGYQRDPEEASQGELGNAQGSFRKPNKVSGHGLPQPSTHLPARTPKGSN